MIPQLFAYLILPIYIYSTYDYIRLIQNKQVSPKIVSWGLWFLFNFVIVSVALYNKTNFLDILTSFVSCIGALLVTTFAFIQNKNNLKISQLDWICIAISLIGMTISFFVNNPFLTIVAVLVADTFSYIPNIKHALKNPEQESLLTWILVVIAKTIGLLTIQNYTFFTLVPQIQSFILNFLIFLPVVARAITKRK
jgi:hypothetical protein